MSAAHLHLISHAGEVLSTWPYPSEHRARVAKQVAQAALERRALTISMLAEHHGMPPVTVRAEIVHRIRLVVTDPRPGAEYVTLPADTRPDESHYDVRARAAGERD